MKKNVFPKHVEISWLYNVNDLFCVNFLNIVCWIQLRVDDKSRRCYTLGLYKGGQRNYDPS